MRTVVVDDVPRNAQGAINTALVGLTYRPEVEFVGTVLMTFLSDDLGNTGETSPTAPRTPARSSF
jgi:hypothetical protein